MSQQTVMAVYDRRSDARSAVEALLEGESSKMVGVSNLKMVLCPLSEAWEHRTEFDPDLVRVAHILAT